MSPITTHVLDTATGRPAAGMPVVLEQADGEGWRTLAHGVTNADGRLPGLLPEGSLTADTFRMTFDTGAWFTAQGIEGFYPIARIVFTVREPASHYHIPLLLSPFGYSTYRGS